MDIVTMGWVAFAYFSWPYFLNVFEDEVVAIEICEKSEGVVAFSPADGSGEEEKDRRIFGGHYQIFPARAEIFSEVDENYWATSQHLEK